MFKHHGTRSRSFASLLVEFADGDDEPEFVIPEDLSSLSDEDLAALHTEAVANFDALYGDGSGIAPENVAALQALTEGIEGLLSELATRETAQAERDEAAAALAARIGRGDQASDDSPPPAGTGDADGDDSGDADGDDDDNPAGDPEPEPDAAPVEDGQAAVEPVAASARREVRVNMRGVRSRQGSPGSRGPVSDPQRMQDIVLAADVPGFTAGQGMDWSDVGRAVDRRLVGFNPGQYAAAASAGRHLREQHGVAIIRKPFAEGLTVQSNDPTHVDEVMQRAMSERRLPGGSLVASGGWCAPSETIYGLCELESGDGMLSVPEIGISRGGIQFTTGPAWSDIYADTGWCYTEQDDIDGDYDGAGGGEKPCYKVECPPFTEVRLDLCGLCITAGLLQSRGYPELIARVTRGALVAHEHRLNSNKIAKIVAGSTAVTMPANQVGATAPILSAIEIQVEHFRYVNRLSRSTTLEAVFPFWVRGAIRSDLSRRLGVDLLSVSDSQIDGWFRDRGIAPQFVYDWQDLTGAATAATAWPANVTFLLYAAGTWVVGGSDIITLDTIYDSVLLGTNDYTALFTEEGYLVAKMCQDSRAVTVNICPDGSTAAGVDIACNGTGTGQLPVGAAAQGQSGNTDDDSDDDTVTITVNTGDNTP